MFDIENLAVLLPLAVSVALPLFCFALLGERSPAARMVASATCILFALRYMWWRWAISMPDGQEWWQQGIAWTFLFVETAAAIGSISVYVFMSRTLDRSAEVDARPDAATLRAPVDVFIATYNEGAEILERTIICALNIDHPDLRVWVLDDGARPWLEHMARSLGAWYISRTDGKHAKAGNVNHALHAALTNGRPPDYVLLLDADFVAARHILRRTLPLLEEADVGMVQTPQHFYNIDPVQANLLCFKDWPDEQRFFFNHLLSCKDAWGAAFCCGTSVVARVSALMAIGGIATQSVTEDMLTSFVLREHGWRTVFLNERLSLGLAPEGVDQFISQRKRWCLGAMQQLRTRWGTFGDARVGLVNRIAFLDGIFFWTATFAFRLVVISAPIAYWWLHTVLVDCSVEDVLWWLAPNIGASMVFMGVLAGNKVFPILTDATHLLAAPSMISRSITALVQPWGHAFKVTPKGLSSDRTVVHWRLLAPFAAIAILTFLGVLFNADPTSDFAGDRGYVANVVFSVFNIFVLCFVCASCVEAPKRLETRFATSERASIKFGESDPHGCVLHELAMDTALLSTDKLSHSNGEIALDDGALKIPFTVLRTAAPNDMVIAFQHNDSTRHALIRKLLTGNYNNEVETVHPIRGLATAAMRVFC